MVRITNENICNSIYFFFFSNVKATNILDYETEIFISEILDTISEVNEYENKIIFSIVLDDNPNAYVNQNNQLFISTGLLKYSESYEAIVGVMAHEIGHLNNYHINKRKDSTKKLKNLNKIVNLSVIAGSLITNNSEYMMQSLITNQLGIQSYYQSYSRDQEREADYYAVETLNKLNLSTIPLLKLLNYLEKKTIQKGISIEYQKFSSHPIYEERYKIIKNKESKNINSFDKITNKKFNFIRAKVFGFTEKNFNPVNEFLKNDFALYSKSIILSKQGKLKESMKILNRIIDKNQNNKFLLETKADILYSNGFLNEAILFYNKSLKSNPNNHYVTKRIFDIYFSFKKNVDQNLSLKLFNEFSFLLQIFQNDLDLKNKLSTLAINGKLIEWINYFSVEEKFYNNGIDANNFIDVLHKLKNNTSDVNLIKLINKKIDIINENI